MASEVANRAPPAVAGLHHVRLPVSDWGASRDWYVAVLGFESFLDIEEEAGPVGVLLRNHAGVLIGLHCDPVRSAALRGFSILGLTIRDRSDLKAWTSWLDLTGVVHSPILDGHLGWFVEVPDPDGIIVRLHTPEMLDVDDA